MDRPLDRLANSLLGHAPGSALIQSAPGRSRIKLATELPTVVVLLEAPATSAGLAALERRVSEAVAGGKSQPSRQIVIVNPAALDLAPLVKRYVRPTLLVAYNVGLSIWVPGRDPVHVRGARCEEVLLAARDANEHADETVAEAQLAARAAVDEAEQFLERQAARPAVVCWALVALCFVVFGLELSWGRGEPILVAGRMGAEIPARVLRGEWWRLFAAILLHASFSHLAWNSIALLLFGPTVERLLGGERFLVLFVASGLCGNLLSITRVDGVLSVGASGGIWGVLAAAAVVVTVPSGLVPAIAARQLRRGVWRPVLYGLLYSVISPPHINVVSHLGGGIAGAVLTVVFARAAAPHSPATASNGMRLAASALAGLLVGSLVFASLRGRPWAPEGPWRLERVAVGSSGWSIEVPVGLPATVDTVRQRWVWGDVNADGAEIVALLPVSASRWPRIDDRDLTAIAERGLERRLAPRRSSNEPETQRLSSGEEARFIELTARAQRVWVWWIGANERPLVVIVSVSGLTSPARRQQLRQIVESARTTPLPAADAGSRSEVSADRRSRPSRAGS